MLALFGLRRVGTPDGDAAVDEACRHITKVKALMRLIRPALGDNTFIPANRRLGAISRRLAPIADGRAVLAALTRLAAEHDAIDAGVALHAIREAVAARAARVDRKALFDRAVAAQRRDARGRARARRDVGAGTARHPGDRPRPGR